MTTEREPRLEAVPPRDHELVVDLPSPRRPVAVAVLSLWLVGWAFGLGFMVQQLFVPGPFGLDRAFLVAWTAAWAAAGVYGTFYMAWLAAGREIVTLESGSLVIRRGVYGRWWTQRWPLDSIRGLRPFGREIPPLVSFALDVSGRGATGVRFESRGRVVRFARSLAESDARAIVQLLRARHAFADDRTRQEAAEPHSHSAA